MDHISIGAAFSPHPSPSAPQLTESQQWTPAPSGGCLLVHSGPWQGRR